MEHLTYTTYVANPAVRAQLERKARRVRARVMHAYVVRPLKQLFRRVRPHTARVSAVLKFRWA
jgi:hypothetical protein